jgi:putative YhdH/YhfP family quinone oxidoreductase
VIPLPAGLSLYEASALGVAGHTAALAIDLMQLNGLAPAKGKVLVNGATGGVASIAIDLLSKLGFHVVALTGKAGEADYLRSLGAAEVLDRKIMQFGTRPLEAPQWAGAVDSVGGEQLAWLARTMQRDGVIAAFGNAGGAEFKGSVLPYILRGVRLLGVNVNNPVERMKFLWNRLATDLRPRHLPRIARRIRFDELETAFDDCWTRAVGRQVVDFSMKTLRVRVEAERCQGHNRAARSARVVRGRRSATRARAMAWCRRGSEGAPGREELSRARGEDFK